jgi:N-acyl-D-aspartate/D-glutamate deacylase
MSKKGSALVKQAINKVDAYFGLAVISDADRLEYSNAQYKLKRELDQNLRTFKEFIDLEENKKVAENHASLIKHQELRLV